MQILRLALPPLIPPELLSQPPHRELGAFTPIAARVLCSVVNLGSSLIARDSPVIAEQGLLHRITYSSTERDTEIAIKSIKLQKTKNKLKSKPWTSGVETTHDNRSVYILNPHTKYLHDYAMMLSQQNSSSPVAASNKQK